MTEQMQEGRVDERAWTPSPAQADGESDDLGANWFLARKQISARSAVGGAGTVQTVLDHAMQIDGALGATLVDSETGMVVASAGHPASLDLEIASAGNSSVVQAKLRTLRDLGLSDRIEDIIITLGTQYHLIRTSPRHEGMFLYLVLDRERANLAMARHRLRQIERRLSL